MNLSLMIFRLIPFGGIWTRPWSTVLQKRQGNKGNSSNFLRFLFWLSLFGEVLAPSKNTHTHTHTKKKTTTSPHQPTIWPNETIFHQPGFSWNNGISLTCNHLIWGFVRSVREVKKIPTNGLRLSRPKAMEATAGWCPSEASTDT